MSQIDVELVKQLLEPMEGRTYAIQNVEFTKTPLRGLEGWRVTLRDVETNEIRATMLWKRERVSLNSKVGAFVAVLGKDYSSWIGKHIRVDSWKPRERKIELVSNLEEPKAVDACVRDILERVEPGRAYTIQQVKTFNVSYPDEVIEEALEKLMEMKRAYKLPTEPARYFVED